VLSRFNATKDIHKLFLVLALFLGGILRFLPVIMAGFPVNDGGMFYLMVEELKSNGYLLPAFTAYNLADIPFAYPPFGFYVTALLSDLFRLPVLEVVRWLPATVSTLALLAFYQLTAEFLPSRTQASLATLFYALVPASFGWSIMGGGITRAFGLAFLFLTITFTSRLFTRPSILKLGACILFGTLAVLSHPETGLQAAGACMLIWFFRGRTPRSVVQALLVAAGVLLMTSPWWGTVLATHGVAPIRSALQTSNDGGSSAWVSLLTLQLGGGAFFSLSVALGLLGLFAAFARREYLLPLWLLVPFALDPRSAGGLAMVPLSMLAASGFDRVLAPGLMALREKSIAWSLDRFVVGTLFVMLLYLFFGSAVFGIGLAGGSLTVEDRETIAWVGENMPPGGDFLLLTGEQYSMKDPFQEWFPALAPQHSQTTLQGAEWTLGSEFFPRYGDLVELQHCPDLDCLQTWSERTGLRHDFLVIKKTPKVDNGHMERTLVSLVKSLSASEMYEIIHETEGVVLLALARD
jgi:hypothetical protein